MSQKKYLCQRIVANCRVKRPISLELQYLHNGYLELENKVLTLKECRLVQCVGNLITSSLNIRLIGSLNNVLDLFTLLGS